MTMDERAGSFEIADARQAARLDACDADLRTPPQWRIDRRRRLSPEARESLARVADARLRSSCARGART